MSLSDFYLIRNIKCCNAIGDYEKGIAKLNDESVISQFNKDWVILNKFLYKSILNKPKGLPPILLSFAKEHLHIMEFYELYNSLNIDIINDDDLDLI